MQYSSPPRTLTRRQLIRATALTCVGGVAATAGVASWTRWGEPYQLTLERIHVGITNLPDAFEGFRIGLLSDLHLYPYTQLDHIRRAVAMVNELDVDAIAVTGDYVLENAESIYDLAPVLTTLKARHGVFAVLGNHDYWTNPDVVRDGLRKAGLMLLDNRHVDLAIGRDHLTLAGVDDCWSGKPDLAAALDGAPSDVPVVLLSHEPDPIDDYGRDGRVALQLSGHSHGGQVRLPGRGALQLPRYALKYDMGLYRVGSAQVYTTRGVGVIGPPVRFNCPPEVTELTLASV